MDDTPLPAGYTELEQAAAEQNKDHNIIGIVTDYLEPTATRGTDWQLTFSIQSNEIGAFGMGHRVKFFAAKDKFPPINGVNDVVVLRSIKSKDYRGSTIFLSNTQTQCTVFPAKLMPKEWDDGYKFEYGRCQRSQQAKFVPDAKVMKYAWMLWDRLQYAQPEVTQNDQPSTDNGHLGKQGFALVEKVRPGGFYDLIGHVVKLFDAGNGTVTMYLTDYTFNAFLYNYPAPGETHGRDGDEYGYISRSDNNWKGPPGQYTLAIDLWDSHANYCRQNIREKQYVRLSNVQIAFAKDVTSKLEGKMRGDRRNPSRVNVRKVIYSDIAPDEDLKELLQRKREHFLNFGNWEKGEDHRGKKRKVQEAIGEQESNKRQTVCADVNNVADATDQGETLSKNQKKRKRDKEKKQKAAQVAAKVNAEHNKENRATEHEGVTNSKTIEAEEDPFIPKPRAQIRSEYNTLNPNVAASGRDQPLWAISKILTREPSHRTVNGNNTVVDYETNQYCIEARVLDFWPPDLHNFVRRERVSEFDILDSSSATSEPEPEPIADHEFSDISSDDDEEPSSSGLPADTPTSTHNADVDADADDREARRGYRWTWDFSLLVEDRAAKPGASYSRLKLRVLGDNGTYLLGLEPCNLHKRKNERVLRQLEEKLFILWGNLQEKKSEAEAGNAVELTTQQEALAARRPWMTGLTNRPFRCSVQEVGVRRVVRMVRNEPVFGWRRRFFAFETVVKS